MSNVQNEANTEQARRPYLNASWNRKENAELEREMGAQLSIKMAIPEDWEWTEAHEDAMLRKLDLVTTASVRMIAGMAKGTMKYNIDFSQYSLQELVEFVFDEAADLMNLVSALKDAVARGAEKAPMHEPDEADEVAVASTAVNQIERL